MSHRTEDGAGADDPHARSEGGDTFSADWLALRESVDHRTRSEALLEPLAAEWRSRGWRRVVDLGAGTGSNARYLAPRLPGSQRWVLVDHDRDLLERATVPPAVDDVRRIVGDLADDGLRAVREADLVTGSALLDLVSEAWLAQLVEACVAAQAGALFTTIYDGTVTWVDVGDASRETSAPQGAPDQRSRAVQRARADDARVGALVNAHQARDKGLGGALGPRAAPVARERFEAAGYRTWLTPSPWILDARDGELARMLVEGWVGAAVEQSPDDEARLEAWGRKRSADVADGLARVVVGHLDLLALPPSEPRGR